MPLDFDSISELEIYRGHFRPATLYLSVSESITHTEALHCVGKHAVVQKIYFGAAEAASF